MALRTGYGTGSFTAGKYGLPQVYEGAVSASISSGASASAQRIHIGGLSADITSSATSAAIRIHNGAAADSIATSVSVAGYTTIVGAVSDQITSSTALYWNRVRPFEASDNVRVGTLVNSRYKWLESSNPTTTWATADYLERAA